MQHHILAMKANMPGLIDEMSLDGTVPVEGVHSFGNELLNSTSNMLTMAVFFTIGLATICI